MLDYISFKFMCSVDAKLNKRKKNKKQTNRQIKIFSRKCHKNAECTNAEREGTPGSNIPGDAA